jgi:hypothetical protein
MSEMGKPLMPDSIMTLRKKLSVLSKSEGGEDDEIDIIT